MAEWYCWIAILFVLNCTYTSARRSRFLRRDYTYIEEYNTYYKMHYGSKDWHQALSTCNNEQATIFVPKTRGEFDVIATLMTIWSKKQSLPDAKCLFAGIYERGASSTPSGYEPDYEDEVTGALELVIPKMKCILVELRTAVYKFKVCDDVPAPLLFICKKRKDITCPTSDEGYIFVEKLGKCFKINNMPKTWKEAREACYDDGGMLAAMSPLESDTMRDILNDQYYFAASHGLTSTFYYFHVIGNQLHAKSDKVPGNCVRFSRKGRGDYVHTTCETRLPFICEMEVFY